MTAARTRAYRKGVLEDEDFPVHLVSEHLEDSDVVVWVDFCEPTQADVDELSLELHELAIEDALGPHQRPKLDRYASHSFLASHAVMVDRDAGELVETEVDAFIADRWLVTVRKGHAFPIDEVTERWDRSPDLAHHGVGFLLYGLLDVMVDGYFDAVEAFDDYYDEVSDQIFADQPLEPGQQRHWFEMRRALMRLHRLVVPMREAVSALMRREHDVVADELYPYYQDVYDHILRISESTDSIRDLISTIVETNLSLRDYRQNQTVKKVSSWAAIIAVPALITGYYGMNVEFPGIGTRWGAAVATVILVVVSFALYRMFKRRDWL